MNFWDTCTWIAPSRISAGSSASSPDPAVISFRHSIGHAHAIRDIFWADLQCWDPILLFSLKQLRVKQICFPWDADRFGICTIFYRDYQGLHQMWTDLVLCALINLCVYGAPCPPVNNCAIGKHTKRLVTSFTILQTPKIWWI